MGKVGETEEDSRMREHLENMQAEQDETDRLVRLNKVYVSKIGDLKASDDEMKFRLLVKLGQRVLLDVVGIPRMRRAVTMSEMAKVPEAEALIEKLIGVRIHILQVVDE